MGGLVHSVLTSSYTPGGSHKAQGSLHTCPGRDLGPSFSGGGRSLTCACSEVRGAQARASSGAGSLGGVRRVKICF